MVFISTLLLQKKQRHKDATTEYFNLGRKYYQIKSEMTQNRILGRSNDSLRKEIEAILERSREIEKEYPNLYKYRLDKE